ncbi:YueI family protein [Bacillus sp. FJAT-50079]|uniref:YueI family protein n=1 Tax=Bacillus sp. FJAT-50079 TaxID=2833577 RepID=UPI001BCA33D5|nr:YueI family protein [Bacillus sp. FJAT-50079]
MKNTNVDDYLQAGVYGPRQIKPEERRKFLGTIRERIAIALTKGQVMENGIYSEVIQLMDQYPDATLLLNGDLDYSYLSDYIQQARAKNISYSIVTNQESQTRIGLVLTCDYAIHQENIYITKQAMKKPIVKKKKKGFFARLIHFIKK